MTEIATQTYGLSKEFTADFTGTIQALHDAGFQGIEPLIRFEQTQGKLTKNVWTLETLKTGWEEMRSLGMTFPSVHIAVGYGWFAMPAERIVKTILMLHEQYGMQYFVVSAPFGSLALARRWAKLASRISDAIVPHGCRLVYHNHDDEFQKIRFRGKSVEAMEAFLTLTSPDVLLQVDIGWAALAGDEVSIIKRYADRIMSSHLKDFYPAYKTGKYTRKNMPAEGFAPVGEGVIQTREVLSLLDALPHFAGTVVIDQDKSDGSMLEALKNGYKNVRAILDETGRDADHG